MSTKKIMNFENAINRINWRFTNENVKPNESKITINKDDIDSVKFLVNWINKQKQQTIKENELFAKLYCYALRNEIEFYKDIKFANVKLQDELKKPIMYHYENIATDLNNLELTKYFQSLGLITDHMERMLLNKKQEQEQKTILKSNSNSLDMIKYVKGIWSKENVFKALNNSISECVNKFKNI